MTSQNENNDKKKIRKLICAENKYMFDNENILEIGIDEAGRGPLFGRVYVGAVILPKTEDFPFHLMKDSKRFTSEKKLEEIAKIIMEKSIAYSVQYSEHYEIDKYNILSATMNSMNNSINEIKSKLKNNNNFELKNKEYYLLIDGNYFRPKPYINNNNELVTDEYSCIEKGDSLYCSIAAASILAKYHRDKYIYDMCERYPKLDEIYNLKKNKGYGTAKHMNAIREIGRSEWHRKSFNPCRDAKVIEIE